MSYRFPSASQLEKISVAELKKYINSVNQAAKAIDEEPVPRLSALKSSNTAKYIDEVMELSKKLTASKLKNKGVRPTVISKLAKAIDDVKSDGGVSQKSVKRAKSRKATRARKSLSTSRRKTVSSRKKSRKASRKRHRSSSRTKKRARLVGSGLSCEVPMDTCVKDTKNYKIADIRALAERCGVSTSEGGKNKTRAQLCRDIVAAQGGGAEVPSPVMSDAEGEPSEDGEVVISDNDCRKNTARYKIAQIRELATRLGISLTDPSGKRLTRAELCDAIRDSQTRHPDGDSPEEPPMDDIESGEEPVGEMDDDSDGGEPAADSGCTGMRLQDCMNTKLNTKEAVYEMARKCGIDIYKPGTKIRRPKAQLCAEIARFSVDTGEGFSESALRARLESASTRAEWKRLLDDLGFEYGQPSQGAPSLQKKDMKAYATAILDGKVCSSTQECPEGHACDYGDVGPDGEMNMLRVRGQPQDPSSPVTYGVCIPDDAHLERRTSPGSKSPLVRAEIGGKTYVGSERAMEALRRQLAPADQFVGEEPMADDEPVEDDVGEEEDVDEDEQGEAPVDKPDEGTPIYSPVQLEEIIREASAGTLPAGEMDSTLAAVMSCIGIVARP